MSNALIDDNLIQAAITPDQAKVLSCLEQYIETKGAYPQITELVTVVKASHPGILSIPKEVKQLERRRKITRKGPSGRTRYGLAENNFR